MKIIKPAAIENLIGAYIKTNTKDICCLYCDTILELQNLQEDLRCPKCGRKIKIKYYRGDIS